MLKYITAPLACLGFVAICFQEWQIATGIWVMTWSLLNMRIMLDEAKMKEVIKREKANLYQINQLNQLLHLANQKDSL